MWFIAIFWGKLCCQLALLTSWKASCVLKGIWWMSANLMSCFSEHQALPLAASPPCFLCLRSLLSWTCVVQLQFHSQHCWLLYKKNDQIWDVFVIYTPDSNHQPTDPSLTLPLRHCYPILPSDSPCFSQTFFFNVRQVRNCTFFYTFFFCKIFKNTVKW